MDNVPPPLEGVKEERLRSLVVSVVQSSPSGLVTSKVQLSSLIRARFGDLSDEQERWLFRSVTTITKTPIPGVLVKQLRREGRPFVFADAERWSPQDWPRIQKLLKALLSYGSPEERRRVLEDPLREWCRDWCRALGLSVWGRLPGSTSDFVLRVDGFPGINVEVRNRRGEMLNHLSKADREIFARASRAGVVSVVVTGRVTAKFRETVSELTGGLCRIVEIGTYVVSSQRIADGLKQIGMPLPVIPLGDGLPAEITARFATALEEATSMVRSYRKRNGLPLGVEPSPDATPVADAVGASTPGRALRSARFAMHALNQLEEILQLVASDPSLTQADVAARLGVSVPTVRRRLRYAVGGSPWSPGRPKRDSTSPDNSITKLGVAALRVEEADRQGASTNGRVHGDASKTNANTSHLHATTLDWWQLAELDLLDPAEDEAIVVKSDGSSFVVKATPPPAPRYMGRWAPRH